MRIGLLCLGIGPFGEPKWMADAAQAAERHGFASIFVGNHFAFFDTYRSPYPYLPGGDLPVPGTAEIHDPFVTLTWLAAHTEAVRLGTGIALVPLLNPLVAAKQVASVDQLSGGRMVFGAGVGWSQEEYRAAGVPWERRWARMDDHIAAMRCLWSDGPSTYDGEFSSFEEAQAYPKPTTAGAMPVYYGGNGDLTLRRVARNGQGWIGMNLTPDEAADRVSRIRTYALDAGRDPEAIEYMMLSSHWPDHTIDDLKRFRDAGLAEILEFGHSGPPVTDDAADWVGSVARRTVDQAAGI